MTLVKKIIVTFAAGIFSTTNFVYAQQATEAPFDLNEAIAMEAFLRGVAYQCLQGKTQNHFISNSKRQVTFAAQEMGLSKTLYEQLEEDIEKKAGIDIFKQLTPMQCSEYQLVLVQFDLSRSQTLDTLEDILKSDLGAK